jgi:hypothetical protein
MAQPNPDGTLNPQRDFAPIGSASETPWSIEPPKLEAALRVNAALGVQAERLIAAYVAPESDRGAIINELIALLDGPAQREADRLAAEALGEPLDSINYH